MVKIKGLDNKFEGKEISDLQRLRLYLRIGTGAASILGYVLFGPFGIAASLGGGIISERIFTKSIESQKQELSKTVEDVINNILYDAINTVQKRLQNIYTNVVEALQNQASTWFSMQRQALMKEVSTSGDNSENLDEQLKRTEEFISKLGVS